MELIVLGTVALDKVHTPYGVRNGMLGGSAVHFSMSARLFSRVNLVASVGEDFPERHIHFLKSKGINLESFRKEKGQATFKWEGRYEGDMNCAQTLKTELGILLSYNPEICQAQRCIKNIFLANVDPEVQLRLLKNMHSPAIVGLDSMNFYIDNKRQAVLKVLKKAGIFLANDQEARSLSGEGNLLAAARWLASRGPRIVLIKKGEHGVILYTKDFLFCLPAYPVEKVVDPTGAGDTFAGAFMGYLSRAGKITPSMLRKAAACGTVAASFNVQGFGVENTAKLDRGSFNSRMAGYRKIISF